MGKIYKNPEAGKPLLSVISTGFKTPILEVKFCSLVNPYYYPNSPTIPRYSITCVIDPEIHKDFLKVIQTIEKNEKVDSILKVDTAREGKEQLTTGKILIKFQSKEKIPVYTPETEEKKPQIIELEDDLAAKERVVVIFDVLRYTKKNTLKVEHGISYKPTCVYYYGDQE